MRKKFNRGFTLIELIISMAILNIVILISYNMINNITTMFDAQLYTTNHQVSINDLNKFLSRDIQYSVNVEGPIFSTNKLDGSKYTLNNIDKDDEVDYEYKITTNENKEVVYAISIKNAKYSIYRYDYNGVSLEFVYNDKLIENGNNLKAPLVIEQSSNNKLLYYVNLQSMDKKNNEYRFQVTSRYQSRSISGDSNSGNIDGNGEEIESSDESEVNISNKNLVFEYKKLYKIDYSEDYKWQHKVIINLDETKSKIEEKQNTPLFSDDFAIIRDGEKINAYTSSWWLPNVETISSKVKQIKGFKLKFEDGIKIKNVNFMGEYYGDLNESNKEYIFSNYSIQNQGYTILLSGKVEIEENSKVGDTYIIEIEFIY